MPPSITRGGLEILVLFGIGTCTSQAGNRLVYLNAFSDPYYPSLDFPKLTSPQWVGEPGVEAVIVLSTDDLGKMPNDLSDFTPLSFNAYLRPILNRLKRIDGRAPVSITTNKIVVDEYVTALVQEGVNLDVHSINHTRPLLTGDFCEAAGRYHSCIDNLSAVVGNHPVAFRFPCADSRNSPSPRFYAEIAHRPSSHGHLLKIDSSVFNIVTSADASLPRDWTVTPDGKARFPPYIARPEGTQPFVNTVANYPYPYIINPGTLEFPCASPSDYQGAVTRGDAHPDTLRDMKISLDVAVRKQGVFTHVFHPTPWMRKEQVLELVDYAVAKHGSKVIFLNFNEAAERMQQHLLLGQPFRTSSGQDNGVRLLDLNGDGFQDVLIGNNAMKTTRLWSVKENQWQDSSFPIDLHGPSIRFGILNSCVVMLQLTPHVRRGWRWLESEWQMDLHLTAGLDGVIAVTASGKDAGVQLRDLDLDGDCELIIANYSFQKVFHYSNRQQRWVPSLFRWPESVWIVDANGSDAGLRFVDLNQDGFDDLLFSNPEYYSLTLWDAAAGDGWSSTVVARARGASWFPMIVRSGGSNNGVWFHGSLMCIQNEDVTFHLCSFEDVLSLRCFVKPVFDSVCASGDSNMVSRETMSLTASLALSELLYDKFTIALTVTFVVLMMVLVMWRLCHRAISARATSYGHRKLVSPFP